ncbi:ABC-2 type transport system ATP-binding protein [Mobiluncus mulieris]|uniref:Daunorubicin/doxorubicin resistance ATP-binding protein DrrA n=1 Tax=Mobiluncus mulieris TaxID=2052 RepID=A0A8G2HS02_9ACTO|nr:ABC transporter ATP-binding protein [Mobiluncus mulieris]EFN93717.1 ABC transporter, ATP-binding protein [Mobiluncus mulieris FB024-16]MBB5845729.1 ABC-2 type transport system ATP-binding protein [Mobiluncus mulieris]MCU9971104.1 ABC transporter ATP-binding protein [Mobiluncus mulieris]MCV0002957.1 ABC transporter ATP-binding protein [Mobiluncus mulieris]NMW90792.1 ABC transporter ATP-binding protein [Mobiluncus mulieris]
MNTPTTNAIEIEGLVKKLGTFELGPLTLNIPRGCFVGLIGENGAGKSTTMKLLHGILEPSAGNIRVLGNNPATDNPAYKARVGFVFDDLYLPENFKLKHVEHFNHLLYGEAWHPQTFWGLAERFDLPPKKWIKKYSRGMKMKLGMVCALSHHAELLILDEPTSGLDPVVRDDVLDIIMDFMQDESHSVLFSSHIISDLQKAADYVAFIHKGKLLMMEAKDELSEKYALLQANAEQLASLAPGAILGRRHTEFGDTVLVERDRVPAGFTLERPSIEDIMVYLIKGEEK